MQDININQQILESLRRQEQLLSAMCDFLKKPKLGLHNEVGTVKIYCNRNHNCNWFTWDSINEIAVPIEQQAITGYLHSIEVIQTEYKNKPLYKLNIHLLADRKYILEAGIETLFSKSVLSAISKLTPQQIKQQTITFQPRQSQQEEKVLFCSVYIGDELVKGEFNNETDFKPIIVRVMGLVNGFAPTPPPQVAQTQENPRTPYTLPAQVPVKSSSNGSAFSDSEAVERGSLIEDIGKLIKSLNWSDEDGRGFLIRSFNKKSRQLLTTLELRECKKMLEATKSRHA